MISISFSLKTPQLLYTNGADTIFQQKMIFFSILLIFAFVILDKHSNGRNNIGMSNIIRSTTDLALHIAREYIRPGGVIVDATCGNGHDTLALAKAARDIAKAGQDVTASRRVTVSQGVAAAQGETRIFAFDIQQDAIDATNRLLAAEGFGPQLEDGSIKLICDSHENMAGHLTADGSIVQLTNNQTLKADLIVFNLGYLPGGDKSITTRADSSLEAIRIGLNLLARDGAMFITMYSGHEEGAKEKAQLLAFARNLDSREFHVAYVNMANQPNNPPEILIISRKL